MKLDDLFERVSPLVFHFADLRAATHIIKSDTLRSNSGRVSVSRSIIGSYPTSNRMIGVFFVLDGDALNQRYAGRPFGGEEYDDDYELRPIGKTDQLEDGIMTKEIKSISRYIRSVVIFVDERYLAGKTDMLDGNYKQLLTYVSELKSLLFRLGKPTVMINKERDLPKWRYMRPMSRAELQKLSFGIESEYEFEISYYDEYDGQRVKRAEGKTKLSLSEFEKAIKSRPEHEIKAMFKIPTRDVDDVFIELVQFGNEPSAKLFHIAIN